MRSGTTGAPWPWRRSPSRSARLSALGRRARRAGAGRGRTVGRSSGTPGGCEWRRWVREVAPLDGWRRSGQRKSRIRVPRHACPMDDVAIGRLVGVIRRRLGLRQTDVADRAKVSQQLVSLLETGGLGRLSLEAARGIASALGAELVVTVRWRGPDLDRMRDEGHAAVVATIASILNAEGWLTAAEVTYSEYGERGSIDLLAFNPAARILLVVEVKTEVVSVEETLRRHDAKVRLAPRIARQRFGWSLRRDMPPAGDHRHTHCSPPDRTSRRGVRQDVPGPRMGGAGMAPEARGGGWSPAVPDRYQSGWWSARSSQFATRPRCSSVRR